MEENKECEAVKSMNIFQRMSAATEKIAVVAKNLEVGFGGNKYKAVSEADVLAAVKPIEKELGIYSYPTSRTVIDSDILSFKNSKGEDKTNMYLRVETIYRFVNIDKPEDFLDITTYGDGIDSQDKAPGKAMTYGDKYALLKAYKIQTGDDPDAHASEDGKSTRTNVKAMEPEQPAYPNRNEMLREVGLKYPFGEVRNKLLTALKAESLEKMSDAQLMAVYNKVAKK